MATDNSEPKSGLILRLAVLSIVTVVGVRYALVSYFQKEMGQEYEAKIGDYKNEQLVALRTEADKLLTGGAMPIDKAMTLVASRPRTDLAAIAPKPSDDTAALVGWTQRPQNAPPPPPPTTTPSSTHEISGADAGAAATDGGTAQVQPTGTTGDAGAPTPTGATSPTNPNAPSATPSAGATPSASATPAAPHGSAPHVTPAPSAPKSRP